MYFAFQPPLGVAPLVTSFGGAFKPFATKQFKKVQKWWTF